MCNILENQGGKTFFLPFSTLHVGYLLKIEYPPPPDVVQLWDKIGGLVLLVPAKDWIRVGPDHPFQYDLDHL